MHEELATLDAVAQHDRELRDLARRIEKAQGVLADMQAAHAAAEALHTERTQAHRELRRAEKAAERKIGLYKQRRQSAIHVLENGLGDTDAAQRQIDQCENILDETETEVLELLEQQETLEALIAEALAGRDEAAATLAEVEQTVPADVAALEAETSTVRAARELEFAKLDPSIQARYTALAARKRVAVVRIERGSCSACQRVVQPQHLADLKRGRVIPCYGCHRWLVPV